MFEHIPIENNRESNAGRQTGYMLELKDILSCEDGKNNVSKNNTLEHSIFSIVTFLLHLVLLGVCYIVGERGFNREAVANNKGEKINGRNVHDKALVAIANYKLAMKYHKEYCLADGKIPSGKRLEDLVLYVRQKMFVHLNGAKNNKSNATKTNVLRP
jgi:hypothetical protein